MRYQLLKLTKHFSTKAERRFAERLKNLHIPFRAKVKVKGREVDFICGQYAIDIDGHQQDGDKNKMLVEVGYTPIHIDNKSVEEISLNFLK
jgi:very-short-patch-repair endonuclease